MCQKKRTSRSLPASVFDETPRTIADLKRRLRARASDVDDAQLGAPAVVDTHDPWVASDLARRRGAMPPDRNEAWLIHLVLAAGVPVCAAEEADAHGLRATRQPLLYSAAP